MTSDELLLALLPSLATGAFAAWRALRSPLAAHARWRPVPDGWAIDVEFLTMSDTKVVKILGLRTRRTWCGLLRPWRSEPPVEISPWSPRPPAALLRGERWQGRLTCSRGPLSRDFDVFLEIEHSRRVKPVPVSPWP